MADPISPIDEVHSAFLDARGWAQGASERRLRRKVRRLGRCDRDFYSADYARLMAYRHELADRGMAS